MNRSVICALVAIIAHLSSAAAKDGQAFLQIQGTNLQVRVQGSDKEDWRLQSSTNLVFWSNVPNFGTLLPGPTIAPWRSVGTTIEPKRYYRMLRTAGLYDPSLLRTFSLTFTQANWSNLMVQARNTTNYVYASLLTLNNGSTNPGVGGRFRGNTSFSGMGGSPPAKKSIALAIDYTITNADLMTYNSLNLNNAFQDETMMRESVYFNTMRQYAVCPAACMVQLYINGAYRGVYSHAQQQNGDLIEEYFPSSQGDRWRAPNMDGSGALNYLGNTNLSTYTPHYELKSDYNTNAWPRLINAIYVLNNTSSNLLREKVDAVLGVDRWLWFLALENILADDDSYWNKGSDYMMYYEPETGRLHPVEHDGNEAFVAGDASLSPLQGNTIRPVLIKLLSIPEWRQRYFAHMRTVLQESFNPPAMTALINQFHALSISNIIADPLKGYASMSIYTNDLVTLKTFVTNRYNFLMANANLTPRPPNIMAVYPPAFSPSATQTPFVTTQVLPDGTNGINSVWLYHRGKGYGRFASAEMRDDGTHGDGAAGDGIFGAATTNYPSGTKVRFYVEARSANPARASSFAPARAEEATYFYRVAITAASASPVVINEILASNSGSLADPQGEFDDWIELHNLTSQPVDLTGRYLSDEPGNLRKWHFPDGTTIPADGFLLVWADEDTTASPGLHASFKLSASNEQIFLADTDANQNAVLDQLSFADQMTDISYGRSEDNPEIWSTMEPTPGASNR